MAGTAPNLKPKYGIVNPNALAAETPFRRPLSRPSLPVALSLSALFPSPPFPSRSLSTLPSHRALSLRSLPVALSPVALSLPPPLPLRSLSPLPSRRPLSRRPLSHRPRSLLLSVPSPSLPLPSLPLPSLPSPSLSLLLCPVALSPVALSPVALYLSRRPRSVPSPTLSPVAPALSRRLAKISAVLVPVPLLSPLLFHRPWSLPSISVARALSPLFPSPSRSPPPFPLPSLSSLPIRLPCSLPSFFVALAPPHLTLPHAPPISLPFRRFCSRISLPASSFLLH
ncbi:unnamed protein product [Closterium sp. NIES-64]|nr:unnamed protein product [Closterium sp. NIES-64]